MNLLRRTKRIKWVAVVDRGGLVMITEEAYQFFYAIETCVRRYLKVSNIAEMNDGFRKHITDCTVNDDNVLFYWSLAGQDEYDKSCQCLFIKISGKVGDNPRVFFCKELVRAIQAGREKEYREREITS